MPQPLLQNFRRGLLICCIVVAATWGGRSLYVSQRQSRLVNLLQHHQLSEARAMLTGYHDWDDVLRRIERNKDTPLAQGAFDVQFEYWYYATEDTNESYPERVEVIRRLLAMGALPRFEHLLRATDQNKMQIARLLLEAGVPVQKAGADGTPLANAAYLGDLDLIQQLLKHGADINAPSANGWRPVLAAAWSCRTDCVRYLLEHGADVSLPYEVRTGHVQPISKVIEERAVQGSDHANIWEIVRDQKPVAL